MSTTNHTGAGRLFCFGLGYSARALAIRLRAEGWSVAGTARSERGLAELAGVGIPAWRFDRAHPLADLESALAGASALLISVPPDPAGDPVLDCHGPQLARLAPTLGWVGYLSTTGVYGDTGGAWVDEAAPLRPTGPRQSHRVAAERDWLELGAASGLPVHLFRLAGIYGPGRSVIDQVRAGTARRIDQPGHVFSRIHVDDIASVLAASIARPNPGAVYNVCDDEPAEPAELVGLACALLGAPLPPLLPLAAAGLSPMAASFWRDHRRVGNDRIKRELGVVLRYPYYRAGLAALAGRPL
jgi:uncharacterized protein YbjT (DUF2867 family)